MISIPAGARILLAIRAVDFRKGAHTLAALAQEALAEDPFSGAVIVYRAKRGDRIKILVWDTSGLVQAIARSEAEAEKRDPDLQKDRAAKRRASRGALPAHLPRIEVTLTPEDTACPCCQVAMTVIGEDTSERLDVTPVQFRVIVTKRPKLVCRACAGPVVQMPAPARLIEGGIPTEALVANVLVARCADHLPLYRQAQIMARQSLPLRRRGA